MLLKNEKVWRVGRIVFIVLEILYWMAFVLLSIVLVRNLSSTFEATDFASFEYKRFLGYDAGFAGLTFVHSLIASSIGFTYYVRKPQKAWHHKALICLHLFAPSLPFVIMMIALRAHGGL